MTTSPPPPIDVEALIAGLYAVAATYQARALGCKHLIEAAKVKQFGLIAADAAKEAAIYEDVVTRIYGQIDAVRAEVQARQQAQQKQKAAPAPSAVAPTAAPPAALPNNAQPHYAVAVNAKAPPTDRHAAFVQLALTVPAAQMQGHGDVLAATYRSVWDALPDFPQVADAFAASTPKVIAVAACEASRQRAVDAVASGDEDAIRTALATHQHDIRSLAAVMRKLTYPSQPMVDAAWRELNRLKDDAAVRVWLARVKLVETSKGEEK